MEDTRINFETAKLAKEKRFNEREHYFYKVKSENDIELYGCTKKQLVGFKGYAPIYHKVRDYHTNKEKLNAKLYRCSAPTQSLLAKWLREKYNLYTESQMYIEEGLYKFKYVIKSDFEYDLIILKEKYNFSTYEEAYEIGLQEALKLI